MAIHPPTHPAGEPAAGLGWRSLWTDIDGPVHYLDFGGPSHGPVIVCVHGLGGSALNWSAIAPLLTASNRMLAPDLAGHGLTQSRGRGTGVAANRELLHRFIEAVPGGPVILMGNSMGGMISLLEAGAAADAVAGLILVDPALPFQLARPDPIVTAMFALYIMPGVRYLLPGRRGVSPEDLVAGVLALCCADPARVSADVVSQHVELARQRAAFAGTERDFLASMRSVVATAGYGMAYRRVVRSVACPVLMVHGDRDRLVPVSFARAVARANPAWSLAVLPGVGHVPQLEAPRESAGIIAEWLQSEGRTAAEAATPGRRLVPWQPSLRPGKPRALSRARRRPGLSRSRRWSAFSRGRRWLAASRARRQHSVPPDGRRWPTLSRVRRRQPPPADRRWRALARRRRWRALAPSRSWPWRRRPGNGA